MYGTLDQPVPFCLQFAPRSPIFPACRICVVINNYSETLIIPDITKTESNNYFIILYLQVISQFLAGSMNCRLLANEKTDGDYNV